jgi:hypothetical protein
MAELTPSAPVDGTAAVHESAPVLPLLKRTYMYYDSNNAQRGPSLAATLRALFLAGQISLETYVWTDPMADWQPVNAVPVSERCALIVRSFLV